MPYGSDDAVPRSPVKTAVMLCPPAPSVTVIFAWPPETGELPREVVPSKNCTVPVTGVLALLMTTAVNVIGCPTVGAIRLGLNVTLSVVLGVLTMMVPLEEVAMKFAGGRPGL